MAKAYPSGLSGAISLPSGHVADFVSMELAESQATEDVSFYGSNTYNPHRGAGTYHMSATVGAMASYGDTGLTPGFGAATAVGAEAVFTVATGVTFTGAFVVSGIRLVGARNRAAVGLTFTLENSADTLTRAWAVA